MVDTGPPEPTAGTRLGPQRARERFHVFADESATGVKYPCYGIGALVVPSARLDRFNAYVVQKVAEHGVVGEARWKKVGTSHGLINFSIELWGDVLNHPDVRFAAIVVHKELYRNWSVAKETAFYKTYTYLLRHAARLRPGDFDVAIDDRSDSYDKRDEVMGIVSNRMLATLKADSSIVRVTKNDSKLLPGLQVADLFTGAITTPTPCAWTRTVVRTRPSYSSWIGWLTPPVGQTCTATRCPTAPPTSGTSRGSGGRSLRPGA